VLRIKVDEKSMKYTLYLNYLNIKYFLDPAILQQNRH